MKIFACAALLIGAISSLCCAGDQPIAPTPTELPKIAWSTSYLHHIDKIFDLGRTIQLEDGTCWNIGYWPADYPKDPEIASKWAPGDHIEFKVMDRGVMKTWYKLTNSDKKESVHAWLEHGPIIELALKAVELDELSQVVTLNDGSRWWIWSTLFNKDNIKRIKKLLKGNLWVCKQPGKMAYYLIETTSFSGACLDVVPAGIAGTGAAAAQKN